MFRNVQKGMGRDGNRWAKIFLTLSKKKKIYHKLFNQSCFWVLGQF